MGTVYRARDTRLPRDAAIKIAAQQFTDRFAREAHAIASLNHPNITALYDIGPDHLVMEPTPDGGRMPPFMVIVNWTAAVKKES